MIKRIVIITLFLMVPVCSFSAPNVTGYNNITGEVTGDGFGLNDAVGTSDTESLIDYIEAGTDGTIFSKTDWFQDVGSETDTQAVARYTTEDAYSGNQSLLLDYDPLGTLNLFRCHILYGNDDELTTMYVSYYVKTVRYGGPGTAQFKIWRMKATKDQLDDSPEFTLFNNYNQSPTTGAWLSRPISTTDGWLWWNGSTLIDDGTFDTSERPGPENYTGEWIRMEMMTKQSTQGGHEGSFIHYFHAGSQIQKLIDYEDILQTVGPVQTGRMRYVVFSTGHVDSTGDDSLKVFQDDIFMQKGTQSRVEIGNNADWDLCTIRELQPAIQWDVTGDRVATTKFQGRLPDDAFVFVKTDEGHNTGFPMSFSVPTTSTGSMKGGTVKANFR